MESYRDVGFFTDSIEFWDEETIGFDYSEELKNLLWRFLIAIPPELHSEIVGYAFDSADVTVSVEIEDCVCNIVARDHPCGAMLEFNIDELRYRTLIYSSDPENNFTETFWLAVKIVGYKRMRQEDDCSVSNP